MSRNKRLHEGSASFKTTILNKVPQLAKEIESLTFEGAPCLRVHSYRALVRVIGYFKYRSRSVLLYRGQTACFGKMQSSLHRRHSPPADAVVERFLRHFRSTMKIDAEPVHRLSTEPLLQHYGIDTRWLDLVDSIPHALFFACNSLCDSSLVQGASTYVPALREYGYIYIVDVGHPRSVSRGNNVVVGYARSSLGLKVVDLRALKPSTALRPHAQHGLLVRVPSEASDVWPHLVARIAIPTAEARRWIAGDAMDRTTLFPPQVWDTFYKTMLSSRMNAFLKEEARGASWGKVLRLDFL